MELYELATSASMALALSIAFIAALSSFYYLYINNRAPARAVKYVISTLLLALVLTTVIIFQSFSLYIVFTSPAIATIWHSALAVLVVIIICRRSMLCRRPVAGPGRLRKWREVDGISVYVYARGRSPAYDAYYDWFKREVYLAEGLFNILSDEEKMAVVYHKLGHVKSRFWAWAIYSMEVLWVFVLPIIISIAVFYSYFSMQQSLGRAILPFVLLALLPIYAASIMVAQWVHEHEVDLYASSAIGVGPLISAFLRLEVYVRVKGLERMIESITFSGIFDQSRVTYLEVLKEVAVKCFRYMTALYKEVLERPLPESHPPLRFRIKTVIARQ